MRGTPPTNNPNPMLMLLEPERILILIHYLVSQHFPRTPVDCYIVCALLSPGPQLSVVLLVFYFNH